eukprot:Blabericola_migrator_1__3129@NODE_1913_length_3571_cov_5_754566_g1223_i0_p1_GENE_NODE_1913_length_3571_cov_5_754566_g1223_i0NODE_1913_length_3571_cov_5_754566_g1223_i0_p1_ORF_typecomplete_len962_score131_10ATG16/PF08614_11/0_0073ATG16/PF08614_11/4_8e03CENPK/PF11802_8/0_041DUF658/PF04936_12/0_22_NODE_1913_length_3571_cov_5_754566_g1223_i06673552
MIAETTRTDHGGVSQNAAAAAFILLWSQLAGLVARLDSMTNSAEDKMSCEDDSPAIRELEGLAESVGDLGAETSVNRTLLCAYNILEGKMVQISSTNKKSNASPYGDATQLSGSFLHGSLIALLCAFLDNLRGRNAAGRGAAANLVQSKMPPFSQFLEKAQAFSEGSTMPEWGAESQRSSPNLPHLERRVTSHQLGECETQTSFPGENQGSNMPAEQTPQHDGNNNVADQDESGSIHSLSSSIDAIDFLEAVFNSSLFNFCLDLFVEARDKFHAKSSCHQSAQKLTNDSAGLDCFHPVESTGEGPPTLGLNCDIGQNGSEPAPSQCDSSAYNASPTIDEVDLHRQRKQLSEISSVQQRAEAKIRSLSKEKEARDTELREQAKLRRNLRIQISARNLLFEGLADLASCSIDPVPLLYSPSEQTETETEDARSQDDRTTSTRRRLVIPTPKVPSVLVEVLTDQKLYGAPIKRAVEAVVTLKASERSLLIQNLKLKQYLKQLVACQKRWKQAQWEEEQGGNRVPIAHNRWFSSREVPPPCCGNHMAGDIGTLRPLQSSPQGANDLVRPIFGLPPMWPSPQAFGPSARGSGTPVMSSATPGSARWSPSLHPGEMHPGLSGAGFPPASAALRPGLPPIFPGPLCGSQFCASRACWDPLNPARIGGWCHEDERMKEVLAFNNDGAQQLSPKLMGPPRQLSPESHHHHHHHIPPLTNVPSATQLRKSKSFMLPLGNHWHGPSELIGPAMSATIPEHDAATTPTHVSLEDERNVSSTSNGCGSFQDGSTRRSVTSRPGRNQVETDTMTEGPIEKEDTSTTGVVPKNGKGRKSTFGWQSFMKGWWLGNGSSSSSRRKQQNAVPTNRHEVSNSHHRSLSEEEEELPPRQQAHRYSPQPEDPLSFEEEQLRQQFHNQYPLPPISKQHLMMSGGINNASYCPATNINMGRRTQNLYHTRNRTCQVPLSSRLNL